MVIDINAWKGYRVIWMRMKASPDWIDDLLQPGRLTGQRLALVELGQEHNQLKCFVAAIRQAILGTTLGELEAGQPDGSLDEPSAWVAVINQISELPDPLILVLTGYDQIESEAVHGAVTELLDYQPDTLQILLFCQTSPPLPLPRLRARRVLLEVPVG